MHPDESFYRMSLTWAFQGVAIIFLVAFQGLMGQNVYFNETCDPVDLTHCDQYYPDPCSCTSFFQCAKDQHKIYHQQCGIETIYDPNILVCVHPNDTKCDTLRPWERCNVTDTRKKQLSFMCSTRASSSSTTTTTTTSTVPNPNGISQQTLMQIITPTIVGVLGFAMFIILVVYRRTKLSATHETIPKPLACGLSDPYTLDLQSYRSSHEYCPGERQTVNPVYDDILPQPSIYESISNSTTSSDPRMHYNTIRHHPTMNIAGQTHTIQRKTQDEETSSSGKSSYEEVLKSCQASQRSETSSSGKSSYEEVLNSSQTSQRSERSSSGKSSYEEVLKSSQTSQRSETSSSGKSSYEEVLKSSQTSKRSETDQASTYCYSISSKDSGYIVFKWLYHNNNPNRPWPNKPVLNMKEIYLPRLEERTELSHQVP